MKRESSVFSRVHLPRFQTGLLAAAGLLVTIVGGPTPVRAALPVTPQGGQETVEALPQALYPASFPAVSALQLSQAVEPPGLAEPASSEPVSSEPASSDTVSRTPTWQPRAEFCPADLAGTLDTLIRSPQFASAEWGVLVEPVDDETVLYSHQAEDFLIPASNTKLLTTAAALRIIAERQPEALPDYWDQIDTINRFSDNHAADELLRQIGGQLQVQQALERLGVDPAGFQQADGSGLSRDNRAQPYTFVTLLRRIYGTAEGEMLYRSLPVGGVSGTLKRRFRGTVLQGRVHAKTGTLRGVKALSGYVDNADYGMLAFSIVVNQPGQSGAVMSDAIDQMVLQIARVEDCR